MPPLQGEAGPSTLRRKRNTVDFPSSSASSSGDSDADSTPTPRKARLSNGHLGRSTETRTGAVSTSSGTGFNGDSDASPSRGKKRKLNGNGNGLAGVPVGGHEMDKQRRARAEKLFEQRQELPFYQGRKAILQEIIDNDTTIIIGETGCGKSTQLPQLLHSHSISTGLYKGKGPSIAITQPRRLPTIALARRVAEEMGCALGTEVGYSVRFEEAMYLGGVETRVRYMTEGVMMRELANGSPHAASAQQATAGKRFNGAIPNGTQNGDASGAASHIEERPDESGLNLLLRYDIIIIDEAHERTLNTDFLCGALKKIQKVRKNLAANGTVVKGKKVRELKLVIMSATLDPSKFQKFFETGRQALLVKGRMYEVATRHIVDQIDDYIEAAAQQVVRIHCAKPALDGDVLVFMPGSEEIETCVELLRRVGKELPENSMKILPLYASLPPTAQTKIFEPVPPHTRRIVIATNIAETSMTIPGVSFVVDTGFKKEKEHIYRTSGSIESLRKKAISKAAAWQRTGRAGRERNGECFRLFTKSAFDELPDFDEPEIRRCNLASAVLQLIAMNQNPFEFEYIDNPGRESTAFQTLAGLSALSGPTTITPLGLEMLRYPLDPIHARILIASFEHGCPLEIIDILSLINSGNLFVDRMSDRESAAESRTKFLHRDGDHLTALNVFRAYLALSEDQDQDQDQEMAESSLLGKSQSKTRGRMRRNGKAARSELSNWCKDNHVNQRTLAQAIKIRQQLRELAEKDGKDWKISCGSETTSAIRSLLAGLFMNTAVIQSDGTFRQAAGNLVVKVHPSSVLLHKKVPAILYDELIVTSSVYARNVSVFEQDWLYEIPWFKQAGHAVPLPADKTKV